MRIKAYLQLLRLPNVFTAVADVAMGFFVTHPADFSRLQLGLLIAASSLLYLAGMVLNDVFDVGLDATERPERPIPSGRVSLRSARILGWTLLTAGLACGWGAAAASDVIGPGLVVTALAAAVVLYDGVLKYTPAAPLGMGACRFLNVLLGMSLLAGPWGMMHYLIAAGVGVYIAGVTLMARTETVESHRGALLAAVAIMIAGVALLILFPAITGVSSPVLNAPQAEQWQLFMLLLGTVILWRSVRAILDPAPQHVQLAVKQCILSVIFLDAGVTMYMRGVTAAFLIALLIVPALLLGRSIYST